jgi:hypothetical protein
MDDILQLIVARLVAVLETSKRFFMLILDV